MTENEIELINIVREHDNPVRAMMVAIKIIISYLMQHESSPRPYSADLRE